MHHLLVLPWITSKLNHPILLQHNQEGDEMREKRRQKLRESTWIVCALDLSEAEVTMPTYLMDIRSHTSMYLQNYLAPYTNLIWYNVLSRISKPTLHQRMQPEPFVYPAHPYPEATLIFRCFGAQFVKQYCSWIQWMQCDQYEAASPSQKKQQVLTSLLAQNMH